MAGSESHGYCREWVATICTNVTSTIISSLSIAIILLILCACLLCSFSETGSPGLHPFEQGYPYPIRVNQQNGVAKSVTIRIPPRILFRQRIPPRKPPHHRIVHPRSVAVPVQPEVGVEFFAVVLGIYWGRYSCCRPAGRQIYAFMEICAGRFFF